MGALSEHEVRFAGRVARIRAVRGMSQQQLADHVGITRSAVSEIETSRRFVRIGEAHLIAEALGVPLADMLSPEPLGLTLTVPIDH